MYYLCPCPTVTLLSITYNSLGGHNVLGEDPLIFLSVYLLVYPLLTWSVGGALMGIGGPTAGTPEETPPQQPLHEPLIHAGDPEAIPPLQSTPHRVGIATLSTWARKAGAALSAVLQPPVVASLLAIGVAASPLRGAFVDPTADHIAPLQFLADGMQRLGAAAVPINMLILGASLSRGAHWKTLPLGLNMSVAVSKMAVMPAVGLATAALLRQSLPGQPASFYLVAMMETCTPTANNLMVMAELGDQNKQALATVIFTQYLLSPLLLTGSTWLAITQALRMAA